MYIGNTNNPVHLIEEALDNALDEALAGYANVIAINIDSKEGICAVLDNGRGIPISDDTPEVISSKLFSGAKFQDKKTAYEISSGLHGVGLVAVNALSKEYSVEVYRNKKYAKFLFKNTILKKKEVNKYTEKIPFSTKIMFKPDKKFFETTEPDIDRIRRRLTTAAAEMPENMVLILNVDDEREIFKMNLDKFFRTYLVTDDKVNIISLSSEKKPEAFKIMMTYEDKGSATPKVLSSINLLPVDGGGSHVSLFYDLLKDFFVPKAKKLNYDFKPTDCLYGLRAYLMLSLKEPKFAGQIKEKLTNRKSEFDKFLRNFKTSLENFAENNPEEIEQWMKRFQDYRRRLDSKKLIKRGTGRRVSTKFTKLRDCKSRDGELFVVEGESAGGSIIISRDPLKHAVLPLKGKSIPNITTKKDVLKNKEVGELIRAMGTGIGEEFDISKFRYDKIICATDADHDGAHIACLLTMVLAVLAPEIIKQGKYFIAQTPLFAINDKKIFVPLWTDKELEKARKDKKNISRFKGLGELSPNQLKVCLLNQNNRHLMKVNFSKDLEVLEKLFSSSEEKRKLIGG
jgi:DNA gyrase subunit B